MQMKKGEKSLPCPFLSVLVSALLSALFERFSVSRIRFFLSLLQIPIRYNSAKKNTVKKARSKPSTRARSIKKCC